MNSAKTLCFKISNVKTEKIICTFQIVLDPGEYFEDISFKRRSEVWTHFWYSKLQKSAKCKYCQAIVNLGQSESTGHLRQHLNSQKCKRMTICFEESKQNTSDWELEVFSSSSFQTSLKSSEIETEIRQKLFKDEDSSFISKTNSSGLWQQQFFLLNSNKTCSKCNLEMIKSGSSSAPGGEDFVDVISLEAIRKSSAEGGSGNSITILNLKAIKEE